VVNELAEIREARRNRAIEPRFQLFVGLAALFRLEHQRRELIQLAEVDVGDLERRQIAKHPPVPTLQKDGTRR
jgi:hypothetical protein